MKPMYDRFPNDRPPEHDEPEALAVGTSRAAPELGGRRKAWQWIALSVSTTIVGAFFTGMAVQRRMDAPISTETRPLGTIKTRKSDKYVQVMVLRDGTLWYKADDP
jgi:hypothetical protein